MTFAIETRNVRKTYRSAGRREVVALQSLCLNVRPGDVFGCIGPNGAGKTTCIKILTGLAWPTAGEARVCGFVAGSAEARRRLGYLPEVASYHEFMAVEELLQVHARLAGVPAADLTRACRDALEAVHIRDRATSRLRELSKGMQQRFGIAQAMVGRPELLILDEPTSGLDPLAQKEIKDIILDLKRRGITIFFSSHKLTEVEHICDRIGIIHRGRLLRCGAIGELLDGGGRTLIRFRGSADVKAALQAAGWQPEEDASEARIRIPRSDTDAAIDRLRSGGASILGIEPDRRSLEEAFFTLIQAAEAGTGVADGAPAGTVGTEAVRP